MFADCTSRCRAQLVPTPQPDAVAIHPVTSASLDSFLQSSNIAAAASGWAKVHKFKAKSGEVLLVPGQGGTLACVLLGIDPAADSDLWAYAALPGKLPPGTFSLALDGLAAEAAEAEKALLGWMLGCYRFSRYKTGKLDKKDSSSESSASASASAAVSVAGGGSGSAATAEEKPLLVVPAAANAAAVYPLAEAFFWCRDLINTPAEDLSPQQLAAEAAAMAAAHKGAEIRVLVGDELLQHNYPAVHTVGRAAARPPVLIDLSWQPSGSTSTSSSGSGEPGAQQALPLVALVGKGVCFDSGGLNIKTTAGMRLMKKDMGGGALMLALAHVVMSAGERLPVRLRVLVPAVENAISGSAYRPGDVLQTRAGITVENNNTDAEGRLILCDAVYEAASEAPDVLIDAATLTGAARVALGPELPAVFCNDDDTWLRLEAAARQESDPCWRLPLWPGYRKHLDSKVADLSNTGEAGQAGAIAAALFIQEFVRAAPAWVHIDTAGWVSGGSTGPGRPEGGEALGLRALWRFLQDKYAAVSK